MDSLLGGSNGAANGSKNGNGSTNGNGAHRPPEGVAQGIYKSAPKLAWFFDWNQPTDFNSARELFTIEPVFREMIDEFDQRLMSHFSQTDQNAFQLQAWLASDDPASAATIPADVRQFVLQAGLAKVWLDWGVEPDAVLGLGVGQYVASCAAGCLCFNDALVLVVERAKVASSDAESADEELLKKFETFADQFNYYPPNLPLICSLSGEVVPVHRSLGGSYWREHCVAEPMATKSILALGEVDCDFVLNIGAASSAKPPSREISAKHLQSLIPNQHASVSLLSTLGQLYAAGLNPSFANLGKHWKRNRISLPTYPFQKKRYWITEIDSHVKEEEVETVKG